MQKVVANITKSLIDILLLLSTGTSGDPAEADTTGQGGPFPVHQHQEVGDQFF
jgi:hypothetical protein